MKLQDAQRTSFAIRCGALPTEQILLSAVEMNAQNKINDEKVIKVLQQVSKTDKFTEIREQLLHVCVQNGLYATARWLVRTGATTKRAIDFQQLLVTINFIRHTYE